MLELDLNIAMTALVVIARSGCKEPCRWDDPCNACFASQMVAQLMESKDLKKWRRRYKIVATKPRKKERN